MSEPHTSESALKCLCVRTFVRLYVCTYVATYRKCFLPILRVLEIQIQASQYMYNHKIVRDSSNAERLSRQSLGKLTGTRSQAEVPAKGD